MSERGPDEMYCRACGELIKQRAAICPHCGVANDAGVPGQPRPGAGQQAGPDPVQSQPVPRQGGPGQPQPGPDHGPGTAPGPARQDVGGHDPSMHATTVSDKWYAGVALGLVASLAGLVVPDAFGPTEILFLAGWLLIPMSIYFDREWVRSATRWDPELPAWLLLTAVPLLNLVVGSAYLFRRYNVEAVSPADRREGPDRDPLDELRARYSRGELSDEEFERKVERLVRTEDRETAREHLRDRARGQARDPQGRGSRGRRARDRSRERSRE